MSNNKSADSPVDISRRRLLAGVGAIGAGALFPSIIRARDSKLTLRVLGTHVTLQEPIRRKAEQELGFNIEFEPGGSAEVLLRASTSPESFDLYEQWSDSTRILWRSEAIQSIDIRKLKYWDEINDLSKTGQITPAAHPGAGDVPNKILFVQPNGRLGPEPSDQISFLPYVHNVDSFGYNSDVIPAGEPYVEESWGWLLDPAHSGRVAIVNAPSIGVFDLALAARARGLIEFDDIGAMTEDEVDALFRIALDYKLKGHFRSFWRSVPDSAKLMLSGDVDIASMFSPGVTMVRSEGMPCLYAAPKEGYRAWQGVMCMSRNCVGEQQDAAYAFMDWWLSGWAGAFIARQGYYISNPERARLYMENDEWDYWYEGLPATRPLPGPDGRISVKPGETRRGGSYTRRFENIAVWNTIMPTYDLTVRRWSELVIA